MVDQNTHHPAENGGKPNSDGAGRPPIQPRGSLPPGFVVIAHGGETGPPYTLATATRMAPYANYLHAPIAITKDDKVVVAPNELTPSALFGIPMQVKGLDPKRQTWEVGNLKLSQIWNAKTCRGVPPLADFVKLAKRENIGLFIEPQGLSLKDLHSVLDAHNLVGEQRLPIPLFIGSESQRILRGLKSTLIARSNAITLIQLYPSGIPVDRGSAISLLDNAQQYAQGIAPVGMVSRRLVEAAHKRDLAVYPWGVNNPENFNSLIERGADGVFTRDPRSLREILDAREAAEGGRP